MFDKLLESPAYAGFSRNEFLPQFTWEYDSGQWVMMTHQAKNILLGFMTYYLCTDDVLDKVKQSNGFFPFDVEGQANDVFTSGNNLLCANCWVAPWAPISTYKKLIYLANGREDDIDRMAAFMHSKNGVRRYHERRPYLGDK